MLFRDQCVAHGTMPPLVETDDEITAQGYKIKVNGSYVSEMRLFRNLSAESFIINMQDVIEFDDVIDMGSVVSTLNSSGKYSFGDTTKTAALEIFDVTIDKETGVVTESSIGSQNFTKVFDGLFGNFKQGVDQVNGAILSTKFLRGGKYFLGRGAIDVMSLFGSSEMKIKSNDGATTLATITGTNYTVYNIDAASHGQSALEYKVEFKISGSLVCSFFVVKSTKVDGSNKSITGGSSVLTPENICENQKDSVGNSTGGATTGAGGTNSVYYGDIYYNILFKHPFGGLDSIGSVNITGMSASGERDSVVLQRKEWINTGAATPEDNNDVPGYFSSQDNVQNGIGFASMSYEYYSETIDELWLAAASASRVAWLSGNRNTVRGAIQGLIDGISATYEEFEDGYKAWRVSVSFRQSVGIYA